MFKKSNLKLLGTICEKVEVVIMKRKIGVLLVTIALMFTSLTACNSLRSDKTNAIVTLTTSSGQSYVWRSFNGTGTTLSGQEIALRYKVGIALKKGETAIVTFKCDACGSEEVCEVTDAWAKTFSCDCPIEIDENGNAKEYFAIIISFEE